MISHGFFDLAIWQFTQLSVAIAAVGLFTRISCRRRPVLTYALWLLVVLKSLTPPIWTSPTGIFTWAASRQAALAAPGHGGKFISTALPPLIGHFPDAPVALITAAGAPHSWQPWQVMLAIWACGCIAMLLVITARSRRIARKIDRSSTPPPQALIDLVQATCKSLGLRRCPTLRLSREAVGPAICGTLRPTLVLPATVSEGSRLTQLRIIVVHELVHLRRRDPLAAGVQLLSQTIWWFHPLVWWMNTEISQAREICCDAQAISRLQCPAAEYAQTLIDIIRLRRRFTAVPLSLGISSAQVSARRLDQIMNNTGDSNRRMSWRNWALLLACALLLLPGAGIWSPVAAVGQADTQPAESNKALYDFLGQPVAPPEDLSPLYSKEGLTNAVQVAAKKAGISLKKVEIDDSEFPYLVGVVSEKGDCDKLDEPLGKMPGYIYGGSTSDNTYKAMNITPYSVFPQQDRDRIDRRMLVRMQVLYRKILAEPPADAGPAPDQKPAAAPASQP